MSELDTLLHYLNAQRTSVLAIVDGLDEETMHRPVAPSGWTPAGLLAHLCGAEFLWLQFVLADDRTPPANWPDPPEDEDRSAPFHIDLPSEQVRELYRAQGRISDAHLAAAPDLDAPPKGAVPIPSLAEYAVDVRTIALHMIEETARHAGHLDLVRELVDGRTGLGPR